MGTRVSFLKGRGIFVRVCVPHLHETLPSGKFRYTVYSGQTRPSKANAIAIHTQSLLAAGVAQSVERKTLNLVVEGSSPSFGAIFLVFLQILHAPPALDPGPAAALLYILTFRMAGCREKYAAPFASISKLWGPSFSLPRVSTTAVKSCRVSL